jgi:alkanesulfonate monooxygenase SsuD/methylene tetrahydromethanopterin reductase-like flavin-dependent oxidoreductase (luciferase family)
MAEVMIVIAWRGRMKAGSRRQVFQIPEDRQSCRKTAAAVLMATFARWPGARLGEFVSPFTRAPIKYSVRRRLLGGIEKHGHDAATRKLGLLAPMHLAKTTGEAKARSEAGVMSYFKTILDMRVDYTDWLNRRGVELPARLRTAAGAMVGFETVCEKHAVIGDSQFAIEKIKELAIKTGATQLLTWFNIGTVEHAAVKESMQQFAAEVMPKI